MAFLFRRRRKKAKQELQMPITVPVVDVLEIAYEPFEKPLNKYDLYQRLYKSDPELFGNINRLALMVYHGFQGMGVAIGKELDERERELLHLVQLLDEEWNFKDLFLSVATHLMVYGDDNRAEEVTDIAGRWTFGVWSISPIEVLKVRLRWKQALLIQDILWRQRHVPREHHKLDLAQFRPELFSGETLEERIKKAKEAAEKYVTEYKDRVLSPRRLEVDRGYITSKEVEISFVEPRTVAYIDPNPLLAQINESIFAAIGAPQAAVRGRGRATYASELVAASYSTLIAYSLGEIIKRPLLKVIRAHIRALPEGYKFTAEDLRKIDIKFAFVLDVMRGEMARQIAVLKTAGILTTEELRSLAGFGPLTETQRKQLVEEEIIRRGRKLTERTIEDVVSGYLRRMGIVEPLTPESRAKRQAT